MWAVQNIADVDFKVRGIGGSVAFTILLICGGGMSLFFHLYEATSEMKIIAIVTTFFVISGIIAILSVSSD